MRLDDISLKAYNESSAKEATRSKVSSLSGISLIKETRMNSSTVSSKVKQEVPQELDWLL